MKYILTVIKYEKNDNYEEEMAKFKEENQYGYFNQRNGLSPDAPRWEKTTKALEVVLTEEEFKKVKGESIKVFE